MLPQDLQKRQERQAEDCEIVAIDSREQLNTDPFELIGTDRPERRIANLIQVSIDEVLVEGPHGQGRGLYMMPKTLTVGDQDLGTREAV